MGVKGAALATVCASSVNALCILILAKAAGSPYIFRFRGHFKWNGKRLKEYLIKCFPIICNEVLIGVGNMVISVVMGRQVEEAIAAYAVFRTLEGMVIGFFAGFSNAASILVGANVGAGEHQKAFERAWRLVYLCQATIAAVGLLLIALRSPILRTMSLSGDSYYYGAGMLIIYCLAAIIRMGNWAQNDTYRSAGDAVTGTVLEIIFMYSMLLPCVCISGLVVKAPVLLTFAFCYVDEPIRYVIMQIHMYSAKWIRPVTDIGKATLPEFLESRKKYNLRRL
jgi:Na+-driven multidrug efflux pump